MKHHFLQQAAVLLAILLTSIGTQAATYDFVVDGLYYSITDKNNNYVRLEKGAQNYEGDIEIPASVENEGKTYTVRAIAPSVFANSPDLTSVTVNNYITTIPNYCFQGSKYLKSVTLGTKVESISAYAFDGCTKLTSINLNDNITSLGSSAFAGCTQLKSVTLGEMLQEMGGSVFYGCTSLTSVEIHEGCQVIGSQAFQNCSNLQAIDIPNSVQTIGTSAFVGCSNLTEATIGNGVRTIPNYCFQSCRYLQSVTLGTKVEVIGYGAFDGCTGLTSINLNDNITKLDDSAFAGCTSLQSVTLGKKLLEMGGSVFYGCTGLTSVEMHEGCQVIGSQAFQNCTNLQAIDIPSSVHGIYYSAFNGCSRLSKVTCRITPPIKFGNYAFDGIAPNCQLYVPRGTKDAYIEQGWTETLFKGGITEMDDRAEQSLSLTALEAKTYGDAPVALPAKTTEGLTLTWTSSNTAVATISGSTLTVKGAGEATITATQAGNEDDYKPFSREFTLTVGKAALTITAKSYTIKQGETIPAFAATYAGFKNSESASVLTKQPTFSCTATSSATTGTFPITVNGATAQNYNITFVPGQLTIGAADAVTVTANSYTRQYGEGNPTFGYTSTSTLNGTPTLSCTATATSPVGTYDINVAKGSVTTYNVTYVKGTLTVTKAPLSIKARSITIKQGDPLPTFAADYEGFRNGESESVLTQQPTFACTATSASAPGTYDITVSGATAQNYAITMTKGTLTITAADPVTVTAKNYTRQYGAANPTFAYTSTGAALSGTPTLSCTATTSSPVGSYDIVVGKGSVQNYNATYVNGTLTITKAPLTLTAKNYTITQGKALPAFEATYSGFRNGESESVLTQQPTFTCEATTSATPGEYTITVSDAEAQNYNIKYVAGTLTINPAAAVTVTAKNYTREYGEGNPTFAYTTSGGTLNGTPAIDCAATGASPAGTYTITVAKGTVSNPNVTFKNGRLTVTKAPLTITARDYTITQGQTQPTFTASYEGFKNGENEDVLTQQPNFICAATAASAPGTYPITVKDATAQNYDITFVGGTLTIEAEPDEPVLVDGNCIDGIYYNFLNSNLTASVINGDKLYTGSVTIPRAVKYMGSTYTVTAIAMEAFKNCTGLTSISIPSSVSTISDQAFYGCSGLTSVTIPDGVTSIGNEAFRGCSNLATVVIGDDVKTIGNYAFYECKAMAALTLGKRVSTIGERAFYYCSRLPSVTIPTSVTSIGPDAFANCRQLYSVNITSLHAWCQITFANQRANPLAGPNASSQICARLYLNGSEVKDLVIPNSVTSIKPYAFVECQGLRAVTIPTSVSSIGSSAFYSCDNLTSVNIEGNGTTIGTYAFYGCRNLATLNITGNLTSIGANAFEGCSGLKKVDITDLSAWCKTTFSNLGAPLEYAHHLYLNGVEITDLQIPSETTTISARAFSGCTALQSVSIPSSVKSIGYRAFYGCTGLASVKIPDSVTTFGTEVFSGCTGLTSVTLGNGIPSIGYGTFNECTSLTSVEFGTGITSIGEMAFNKCTGLQEVTLGSNVQSIVKQAFHYCNNMKTVTIPSSVTSIEDYAFHECYGLKTVNITSLKEWCNISFHGGWNGSSANPMEYATTLTLNGQPITDLVIPEGVSSIGNNVFKNMECLKSVLIGNDVTSIGQYAFAGCPNLKDVTIGSSVTSVGQYAFSDCTGMQNLVVGNSVNSIGNQAFYNCGDLRSIVVVKGNNKYDSRDNCNALITTATNTLFLGCRNTVIPETVKTIADWAFYGCKGLAYLNIPNSVTSFGDALFRDSDLKEVEFHCNTVPSGNTYKSRECFSLNTNLEKVILGEEVTSIGSYAFYGCTNMQTVVSYIQEPFTFGSSAFNFDNTYNTCKLIVPAGTRDAYIAKGWTESVFRGGVVEADANTIEVAGQTANQGKSVTIPIEMNNVVDITAMQFEVVLPEGITWSGCKLTDRKEDHVISAKKQANGIYMVTVISMGDENFSGNSGAVANLTLNVAGDEVPGLYRVQIRNIELTTEDGDAAHPIDVNATLTIKDFTMGDTNGDGGITITDAVAVISHILGNNVADFVSNAADVNDDGDITITDAVNIIKMVLSGETSFAKVRNLRYEDFEQSEW